MRKFLSVLKIVLSLKRKLLIMFFFFYRGRRRRVKVTTRGLFKGRERLFKFKKRQTFVSLPGRGSISAFTPDFHGTAFSGSG